MRYGDLVLGLVVSLLSAAPQVAVLSSQGSEAELRFQPLGTTSLLAPVARFTHAPGSSVAGALLPGTRTVVATATMKAGGDLSFGAALVRLDPGQPARVLAREVAVASRPLVSEQGRVFIARGAAGGPPEEGRDVLRVDSLTVDEVNVETGTLRTVYATKGYVTHLAGAFGRELLVYEVGPQGARLFCVHVDTLEVRVLVPSMPPMARDFFVDAPRHRALFTQLAGEDWAVQSVDLRTGELRQLATAADVALLPAALPDGTVVFNPAPGRGLVSTSGAAKLSRRGEGFERLRAVSDGVAIVLHERPSDFPSLVAARLSTGEAVPLAAPAEARLDVAGVLP